MRVLSLFDGISCAQQALRNLNIKYKYYASEIDINAIKVTLNNFPKTIQLGNVCDIKTPDNIDLLVGGSPCQGFSFAGKQLAFDDPRSKLFFEYVRVLEKVKPKYFLLENVSMKQKFQDVITKYLGVSPICINSNLVSAQNRKRLYWTNIPNITQPIDQGILLKDIIEHGFVDKEKSYCIDANYYKGGDTKNYFKKCRRQLVFTEDFEEYINQFKVPFRKLTPIECERLQTLPDNYTKGISQTQRYKCLGNGMTVKVIEHFFKNLI